MLMVIGFSSPEHNTGARAMTSRSSFARCRALGKSTVRENHKKFFSAITAHAVVDAELRAQPSTR